MAKRYTINECYLAIQGEGVRAGTANVFLRFTGCNMRCAKEVGDKSPGGFDCDTEFVSGRQMTKDEVVEWVVDESRGHQWVICTGGEPGLQLDCDLIDAFHAAGLNVAIETNGSVPIDKTVDWITVSPKVAEHAIRQLVANEVKYVRGYGQAIPKTVVQAPHMLISPAFDGRALPERTLQWCKDLVKNNPPWRLSVQLHNLLQER